MSTQSHTKMYGVQEGMSIFHLSKNVLFANYRPNIFF